MTSSSDLLKKRREREKLIEARKRLNDQKKRERERQILERKKIAEARKKEKERQQLECKRLADSLKLERERIVNERRRQVEIKKRERERAKIEKIRQNQERRKLALNQKIALAKKREMEKKQPRKEKKNEKNKTMGILNSIFDHFEKAEFSISPNKKLKTLSRDFQKAFGLSLVFYKGNIIAEDTLTLAALNNKSSATIFTKSTEELKIRASMKVGNVEELFLKTFGVTVQIKNTDSTKLIDNKITLGDAVRNSN